MGRKKTLKGYKRDLTSLIREKVLARDKNRCQKCLKYVQENNAHLSHVIPKGRNLRLRWDMQNLKILCMRHHIYWWHKSPVEAGEWFKNKFPERWEYLQKKKNIKVRWRIPDYKEMIQELKTTGKIDWGKYE